jgi:hypothetical protein
MTFLAWSGNVVSIAPFCMRKGSSQDEPGLPFAQHFAGLHVDEVRAGAGRATNSLIALGSMVSFLAIFRSEGGLHFHAGGRTSKYEEALHGLPVRVPIG